MKKLLLILAVQTSAACAHLAPQMPPAPREAALPGGGAPAGATALDWYTRVALAQPVDPLRPTFYSVKVTGSLTAKYVFTTGAAPGMTGSADTYLGSYDSSTSALWLLQNGVAPTATNYTVAGDSTTSYFAVNSLSCVWSTKACTFTGNITFPDLGKVGTSATNYLQWNTNTVNLVSNGSAALTAERTAGAQAYAGSGLTAYQLGGVFTNVTADVTSSGASNLISYTLPASTLTTTNRCLRIKGWGTALNNANAKTVALDFGSQTIISKILTPSIANTTWSFQATVCRSGASTQDIYAEAFNPMGTAVSSVDANTVLYQAARTAGTQTETATITIKGKTTTATTTDVTMDGLTVEAM